MNCYWNHLSTFDKPVLAESASCDLVVDFLLASYFLMKKKRIIKIKLNIVFGKIDDLRRATTPP